MTNCGGTKTHQPASELSHMNRAGIAEPDSIAVNAAPIFCEWSSITRRNLAVMGQKMELVHGDYVGLLEELHVPADRGVVAFVAPPWGTALDEVHGLDLCRTAPPIAEVIEQIARQFSVNSILFATQVYEKVTSASLRDVQAWFDWTDLRIYDIDEKARNHGILLGTRGWSPR